jgi:CRISPR type IV-associated protein Csf1
MPSGWSAELLPRALQEQGRLTTPWLVLYAARAALPGGAIAAAPGGHCPLCGFRFVAGERAFHNPTAVSTSFADAPSLRGSGRNPICRACFAMVSGNDFMQKYASALATTDGLYAFRSNDARAHWLLNPPAPPFAMAAATATKQHVWWRTPLATSTEIYPVRVGPHLGFIRRKLVAQAATQLPDLMRRFGHWQSARSPGKAARRKTSSVHPFARLDRDMLDPAHGLLKTATLDFLASGQAAAADRVFAQLNALEAWSLSAIVYAKPLSQPPEPMPPPSTDDSTTGE